MHLQYPLGRYRYVRLPFGIKTARDIFAQEMSEIFKDIEGVEIIADDILVFGKDVKQHNERLERVLKRAREVDLRLNPKKSKICKSQVTYVGHLLT